MFDIGWSELLLIAVVALIAIGPKELPGALRTLGQMMGKVRRMAGEFQGQFQEAMREAEIADLKKEVDEMTAKAQSYADFDPVGDVRRDIEKAVGDLPSLDAPAPAAAATEAPVLASEPASDPTAIAGADAAAADQASVPPVLAEPVVAEPVAPPVEQPPAETAAAGKPDAGRAPA